jgi:hypothetical protein
MLILFYYPKGKEVADQILILDKNKQLNYDTTGIV